MIDPAATLREQVDATGFAPASSRFGPYCDNILGMNWKLPNGRVVRIGERVVKTTTGYDLFRFLLSSGSRYGQPIDYVLRLRPDCGETSVYWLAGLTDAVCRVVPDLLKNCWMHWLDAIDVVMDVFPAGYQIRIVANCPADECAVAEGFVSAFADTHGLTLNTERGVAMPTDGCPDFVFKSSPEQVLQIARDIVPAGGVRCVVLCYNGVLHGYLHDDSKKLAQIEALIRKYADELSAIGGDWHSRHRPDVTPTDVEANWISILETESKIS